MSIKFHFEKKIVLKNRLKLRAFIAAIFASEGKVAGDISIVFCSDSYLLRINREFLKHDYYTDIITFELSKHGEPVQAEIYISVDTVNANAMEMQTGKLNELHRVIFHGILHLCGYADKTVSQKKIMRSKEDFYLKRYGL